MVNALINWHQYLKFQHQLCASALFKVPQSAATSYPRQLHWLSWKPFQKLPLLRVDSATKLLLSQSTQTCMPKHTHTKTHSQREVNQGQRNTHSRAGDRLLKIPPHPNTQPNTILSTSFILAPVYGQSRNCHVEIWLHKHREEEGVTETLKQKTGEWTRGWEQKEISPTESADQHGPGIQVIQTLLYYYSINPQALRGEGPPTVLLLIPFHVKL